MTKNDLPEAVQNIRPLSATQVRNLEKLVMTDFYSVRMDIERFYNKKSRKGEAALRAGADKDAVERLHAKAVQAKREYYRARDEIVAEARGAGLSLTMPSLNPGQTADVVITDHRLSERIKKMREEIEAEKRDVLQLLDKQEQEAKRKIFLSGISGDAETILNTIPTAQGLMQEALSEESTKELT